MIAQSLADGILTGAIIALGAIGVSFGLQILRFANFAHAELITWGAYFALLVVTFMGAGASIGPVSFGWPLVVALGVAAALTGLAAWFIDIVIFKRMRRRGAATLSMVFASFGASLVMRHVVVLIWGYGTHFYTRELQFAVEILPGVRILPDQIFVLGLAAATVLALQLYLTRSRTGMAMRAVAESPALARVCGIEVERVIAGTWIVSGALAAAAGVFLGLSPQVHPEMGFSILLSLFAAAILGGAGSLPGAVVGALLVGLAENLSVLVVSPGYKQAMPFLLLLVVLFVRPRGLFGSRT